MRIDHVKEWKVLGAALDAFNALETRMEDVIVAHLQPNPSRVDFLREQVLHNSTVSFGSKVRLLLALSREVGGPRLSRDKFHRALGIRNALAHGDSRRHIREKRNALRDGPYGEFLVIRSIKGDGTVDEKPRAAAIAELMALLEELRVSINLLAKRMGN